MKVPYNPVPEERPGNIALPEQRINAPVEAFGGASAAGLGQFGKALEHSGDELFQRGIELQKLNNDAQAKEADAQYIEEAGLLHAKFNSLEGKNAVAAYPKYIQDLKESRARIRDTLASDYARKLYDGPSLSTMGRSIFHGADKAGQENKKYFIGASNARIGAFGDQALTQPSDDIGFKRSVNATVDEVTQQGSLRGESPELIQQNAAVSISSLWSKRIMGLSRTDPFAAAAMLEKNKDAISGADYFKVEAAVRSQSRAVGSVNIANDVFDAGQETPTQPAKSLSDMETEARKIAEQQDPKDPLLATHAITALRGRWNQTKYSRSQELVANQQTVAGGIEAGVRDIQELRLDPKVASAIDALPKDKQLAIPAQINRYNAAKNQVTNQDNYQRLWGLSNNNVEDFLNTDLTNEQLSQPDMRKLQEAQRKLKELPNADPRVNRAISNIRSSLGTQLESLGVYRRTDGNKDDYDKFTGAVQSALDVWQEQHGKPATYKEVTETIGPQVIRQMTEPGWLFGTNKVPFYKQRPTNDFIKTRKDFATQRGEPEPSPELMQKEYIRMQFMKLYGKKEAPK